MNGLTTKTARERLKQDGENELAATAKRRPLRMFLGQFRDVMVLILLAATGISAFLGRSPMRLPLSSLSRSTRFWAFCRNTAPSRRWNHSAI
ncbi:MAG: cation-transporting P-type ATPase [Ruminococcus callidus]